MFSVNTVLMTPDLAASYLRTANYKKMQISISEVRANAFMILKEEPPMIWFYHGSLISGHKELLSLIFLDLTIPCILIQIYPENKNSA